MLAESAEEQGVAGEEVQAGLAGGQGQLAAAHANVDPDAAGLEVGRLEVEADAVLEFQLRDAEVDHLGAAGDLARGAELGVGERDVGRAGRGLQGHGVARLISGEDLLLCFLQLEIAGDEQAASELVVPGLTERGDAVVDGQLG